MPGFRDGHAYDKRAIGPCVRCKDERRLRGRRLCVTCWVKAKADGTLENYPLIRGLRNSPKPGPDECQCFVPIPEMLPWGRTCKRCERRLL